MEKYYFCECLSGMFFKAKTYTFIFLSYVY